MAWAAEVSLHRMRGYQCDEGPGRLVLVHYREYTQLLFSRHGRETATGAPVRFGKALSIRVQVFAEGSAKLADDIVGHARPGAAGVLVGRNHLVADGGQS